MLTALIEFISRNHDGIILTLVGLIAGPIVSKLFVKSDSQPKTLKMVVGNSTTVINNYYETKPNSAKPEDVFVYVAAVILVLCLMYVRWFNEVLFILASTSIFLFGFSLGVASYLCFGGYVRGVAWILFFITITITSIVTFYLTVVAAMPEYWTDLSQTYTEVAQIKNVKGIFSVTNHDIYTFLVFQLFGIALIVMLQMRLFLSMLHYMASAYAVDSRILSKYTRSLIVKTKVYQDPVRTWFICILYALIAYLSLNGNVFILFKEHFS